MNTKTCCRAGNTVTEYAIIFSLCTVLAIGGLVALRNAVMAMNTNVGNTLAKGGTISLITPKAPSLSTLQFDTFPQSVNSPELVNKHFTISCSNVSDCTMTLAPGSGPTNATSVDGKPIIADIFALTQSLTESHPELAEQFNFLYQYAGATCEVAATAECAGFSNQSSNSRGRGRFQVTTYDYDYSNIDAYNDIQNFLPKVYDLINNPPASLNPEEQNYIRVLAAESYNIGREYIDDIDRAVNTYNTNLPNGDNNRIRTQDDDNYITITDENGRVIAVRPVTSSDNQASTATGKHISDSGRDQYSMDALKEIARQVLSNNGYDADYRVKVTFKDAQATDG